MITLKQIPKFALDTEAIADRAEAITGAKVYTSEIRRGAYMIRCGGEIVVITKQSGYLKLKGEDIPSLIEELENIHEDIKRRL